MKKYIYELVPLPEQSDKTFWGKAVVKINYDCSETLYSFGIPIIKKYDDGRIERLYDGWNTKIGKHVKAFCGLSKKQFIELPVEQFLFTT